MKIDIRKDAVDAIKAIVDEQQDQPGFVRVFVAGLGWSGPSFGLALDDKKPGDLMDDSNDVVFIMEQDLHSRFGDISVEYMDGGFLVRQMGAQESGCSSCSGCGGH